MSDNFTCFCAQIHDTNLLFSITRWSQLRDHGTSHFCIVDAERNAVSLTTTVNGHLGAGILSPSTGIVLNNEMGDFSTPTNISPDKLPPAPTNFVQPNKRPLSSMTPIIVTKVQLPFTYLVHLDLLLLALISPH